MAEKREINEKMDAVIALCKRRGFVYQGSEIYGGLAGTWDYGPLGARLKVNIEHAWWWQFVDMRAAMWTASTTRWSRMSKPRSATGSTICSKTRESTRLG